MRTHKRLATLREFIRDIVFGMEDGLVSNLGIVFAVWAAGGARTTILLAGLASMFAGALSMSAGSYLSSKSQREVYEAELEATRRLVEEKPKKACKEMEKILRSEGFDSKEITIFHKHFFEHNKQTFIRNFIQKKVHLSEERLENPGRNAIAMCFAFLLGSIFPVGVFFFSASLRAMFGAAIVTIIMLFGVGVAKSHVTHRHWFKSGTEMLLLGLGAGIGGYLIGLLFQSFL